MKSKKNLLMYLFFAFAGLCGLEGKAQGKKDSVNNNMANYYNKLGITSGQAKVVDDINTDYKTLVSRVMENPKLTDIEKRKMIDALINNKNEKLEKVLSAKQFEMLVPNTERAEKTAVKQIRTN